MFSKIQQRAIKEKLEQLKKIKEGASPNELAEIIPESDQIRTIVKNILN